MIAFYNLMGLSSLFYVLVKVLILILSILNYNTFNYIQYHSTDSLIWYVIHYFIPIIISFLCSIRLDNKIKKQSFLLNFGKINLLLTVIIIISLAVFSYIYWGYSFKRPDIFWEISSNNKVKSISYIASNNSQINLNKDHEIKNTLINIKDPYYDLYQRIFIGLDCSKQDLEKVEPINEVYLNQLSNILYGQQLVEIGDSGYDQAQNINGYLIQFQSKKNLQYLAALLKTGAVSNDHYPFYEFLFSIEGDQLTLLKKQRFYYDVAGIEELEINFVEPIFLLGAFFLSLLFSFLINIVRKRKNNVVFS